jgi:hypothetical protein
VTSFPPTIKNYIGKGDQREGVYETKNDPAKLLVEHKRYERPVLRSGSLKFEWPLGVEGVRFSGSAIMAEHHYIGDNDVVLDVTHLDDQRIVLTGMFPGLTGTENMQDLLKVIRDPQPKTGKVLVLPRIVFSNEIIVAVADYDFDHPEDDRNNSWTYTVTFRRTGTGRSVSGPRKITTPVNHRTSNGKSTPRGKSSRVFTVHSGANTLRAIAKIVYGNASRWGEIYNKNRKVLKKYGPLHTIPTKRLPLGLKLNY